MQIKPATQKVILRMVLEAASRVNVKQKTNKLETALENKLKRLFIQHGNQFLKKFATFKSSFKESISNDDIDELFDNTSPNDRMASSIQSYVENAVSLGANTLNEQFSIDDVFSLENPRAVDYLANYGANLVTGIDDYSKQQLRDALTNATEQGMNYQSVAKLIGKMFGEWALKRAKLIAVTEIGNAYQEGNLIVGLDLAAHGVLIEKSWLTRGDDRVDVHCKANADQGWIDVTKSFSSGVERPLDHPRCRCVLLMRRKPDAPSQPTELAKSAKKSKIDFTKRASYKVINNALDSIGIPTSVWNEKVKFVKMKPKAIYVSSEGYIAMNEDRTSSEDVTVKDATFKTVVHELLHSRSMGLAQIEMGLGWEESIVEGLSQLITTDIADTVGYTYTSTKEFKQTYKDHPYRIKWVNPLENVFDTLNLDYKDTYIAMMHMSIKARKTFIKTKLIQELGDIEGTSAFVKLDAILT